MGNFIAFAGVAVGLLAAVWGFSQSLIGMRAKARLHVEVAVKAMRDEHLRELVSKVEKGEMDPETFAEAIAQIEKLSTLLSEHDRRLIHTGLNQPSRIGARRYVKDVLTAA